MFPSKGHGDGPLVSARCVDSFHFPFSRFTPPLRADRVACLFLTHFLPERFSTSGVRSRPRPKHVASRARRRVFMRVISGVRLVARQFSSPLAFFSSVAKTMSPGWPVVLLLRQQAHLSFPGGCRLPLRFRGGIHLHPACCVLLPNKLPALNRAADSKSVCPLSS